jgi:hypothetical protein
LTNIPGPATGCTRRSAGPAASPSSTSFGTPGRCALPESTCTHFPTTSFGKVQGELFQIPFCSRFMWLAWSRPRGISLRHLAVCAKWGIVSGEKARKRFLVVCLALLCAHDRSGLRQPLPRSGRARSSPAEPGASATDSNHATSELTESRWSERWQLPKIIVIGGGLAGLSAVIKIAEMGANVDLFSIVPVKRSHSVCAQGGINAAKNLKGEGDSTWIAL